MCLCEAPKKHAGKTNCHFLTEIPSIQFNSIQFNSIQLMNNLFASAYSGSSLYSGGLHSDLFGGKSCQVFIHFESRFFDAHNCLLKYILFLFVTFFSTVSLCNFYFLGFFWFSLWAFFCVWLSIFVEHSSTTEQTLYNYNDSSQPYGDTAAEEEISTLYSTSKTDSSEQSHSSEEVIVFLFLMNCFTIRSVSPLFTKHTHTSYSLSESSD
jgi:hypothetical protein